MKQKGFTLIELLAVIVVLAVIALIAIPVITSVIDKAKQGALKDSGYGILDSAEMYLAKNIKEGIKETLEFTCSNNKCLSGTEEISYKGNIETGKIRIYTDNKIELCITDNKNAALKRVSAKEITVSTGTCNYGELNYEVNALVSKETLDAKQKELEEKQEELNELQKQLDELNTNIENGFYNTSYYAYFGQGMTAYIGTKLTAVDYKGFTVSNNIVTIKKTGTYAIYGGYYNPNTVYGINLAYYIDGTKNLAGGVLNGWKYFNITINLTEGQTFYFAPWEANYNQYITNTYAMLIYKG